MRWVAALMLFAAACAQAQDADWLRMWEGAQRQRPRTIGATSRIAPPNEPGTPLVIHGRVFARDGRTPARDVTVFAYQTDHTGVYNAPGASGWRLQGWARTDAEGRFTFQTIRPASYPSGRNPQHVHLTIEGPNLPRRWTPELHFLDDPFVSEADKRESQSLGAFGPVRPVTTRNGTQHVDFHIRIADEGRF
ncbi:MAG TPA: hypothetical protein VEO54_04215 [Thermoanaerobaculia bacterium]|nr:hypothetical protein [Thermoanaerobaculia bacterium]